MERGTRYLLLSALGAANTVNAYRPFTRRGPGMALVFAAGDLTGELPLQTIFWQAASTAWMASRGALASKAGRAGLAISVASWAALYGLHRTAACADAVLEDALVEGLGADYCSRLAPPLAATPAKLKVSQLALPRLRSYRRYITDRDISFGDHARANLLDVWRRDDLRPDAKAPVLIQVHGGGWTIGTKQQQAMPLLGHLAEQGWVCVDVNYRLSPRAQWPDHIADVKRGIAWVKQNIAAYGGDPSFIAITGGSAGGHLSALAALTPNDPAFQPGFEDADTTVHAAVPFYGVYDFVNGNGLGPKDDLVKLLERVMRSRVATDRERWEQASPIHRVGPHAPPFFVLHGTNDSLAYVEQARRFVEALRAASHQPVVYAELPRAQHAFDLFASVRTLHTVRAVERFLATVRPVRPRVDGPAAVTTTG